MQEWIHVVWLVLGENVHRYIDTVRDTLVVEHLPGGIVVGGDCRG